MLLLGISHCCDLNQPLAWSSVLVSHNCFYYTSKHPRWQSVLILTVQWYKDRLTHSYCSLNINDSLANRFTARTGHESLSCNLSALIKYQWLCTTTLTTQKRDCTTKNSWDYDKNEHLGKSSSSKMAHIFFSSVIKKITVTSLSIQQYSSLEHCCTSALSGILRHQRWHTFFFQV